MDFYLFLEPTNADTTFNNNGEGRFMKVFKTSAELLNDTEINLNDTGDVDFVLLEPISDSSDMINYPKFLTKTKNWFPDLFIMVLYLQKVFRIINFMMKIIV